MTTVDVSRVGDESLARAGRSRRVIGRILLACGIVSSLLYVATDVLGGLRYEGYSFTAQAISELAAIGAPSKPFVDPLFMAYGPLALAFGVGVLLAAGRNTRLRITGALLFAYVAAGSAFAFFPVPQRGAESQANAIPHIVVAAVVVLLMLLTIGIGAFSLGRRFRVYSLATLLAVVVTGVISGVYVGRLLAEQPTPGLGIVERVNVYSLMAWLAVLAIALLRRAPGVASVATSITTPRVQGMVAPGFEEVRTEFVRNFAERSEIGAAVAVYWRGEKVVDLWGGRRSPDGDAPWEEDTLVPVMSTTKGLAAMTLAVAHARGWLDYDAPVARYWPEFAQNGKGAITVRQLLGHEAGLVLIDEPLTIDRLRDLDDVARVLARQRPAWTPGTRHGYHTMSIGLYMQELIRHVDPAKRTLGRFFHEEIARPLGLEFYIGLPRDIPDERIARMKGLSRTRALLALRTTPPVLIRKILLPGSLLRRSMLLSDVDWNDRRALHVEVPAGNGVGTARAIARAYSAFAEGGGELGIGQETLDSITAPPDFIYSNDVVLGVPCSFSLGFLRPCPGFAFGSSPRVFGSPGAGGSFAFADPDARVGFAYVMNRMDFHLSDDPREKALRDAVYRAVARFGRGAARREPALASRA